jgi:hypothetical protein
MYFMKLRKTLLLSLSVLTASLFFLASCDKSGTTSDRARMQVYLTDDPGDYEAVYIDVQDVRINTTTDAETGWVSLGNVHRGTYNLLTLVNDKDTMLADAEIPKGRIEQIRLVLGNENYVKVDGKMIKLETPSAQQSGLKLNIHQDANEGVLYKLLLDFDVAKSVHQTGNGKYMLKPTIRTMLEAIGGSIRGYVTPNTVQTAVLAIQGTDTVASTYSLNGGYIIKGLNAGAYNLHFLPTDTSFKTQVKTGINVGVNNVTTVDTVRLQK